MLSFDKGAKKCVINSNSDARHFMEAVIRRTISFFNDEVNIKILKSNYDPNEVDVLNLQSLTSIITVEDYARMTIIFTYEDQLIGEIFERYTQNLDINESEAQYFLEETSGDMINVVVGNVLSDFQQPGVAFAISTPIIVNKAQNIVRYKSQKAFKADIFTEYGKLTVFCLLSGDLFISQLSESRE